MGPILEEEEDDNLLSSVTNGSSLTVKTKENSSFKRRNQTRVFKKHNGE